MKEDLRALRRVLKLLQIRPGGFALSLLLGVCGLGAAVALAATSAWLIARASQMPPVLTLTIAATSVRFFGISRALFRYLQRLASHQVALDGMDRLRLGIYDLLVAGPIERVARLQRGDLLNRTGADVDTVGDFVVKSLLPALVALIVGLGTVVGFAFLSVPAAVILAAMLLVSGVVVPLLTMRSTRAAEAAELESQRDLAVSAMTIMDGADELRVSGQLPALQAQLGAVTHRINRARAAADRPAALGTALDRVAMGLAVVGVLLVATPEVGATTLAAVAFAVLVLTPLSAFEGTAELAPAAAQLVRSAQAARRIVDLLGPEDEPERPVHTVPAGATLVAQDLAVGWPGHPVVAEGVSLELKPGTTTAIVGPSGIGKTTLLYTLAGMLAPRGGLCQLNGAATWGADRDQFTSVVSLTTEDAHIFGTTVFENLRVANPKLTREEAQDLIGRMGLRLWLEALPDGLDTLLTPTSISGGERRRLLLARALAAPAPLMLLDEPGEHLDSQTAQEILHELLAGTGKDRGVVVVTHRLSELALADRILLVEPAPDNGDAPARVVKVGTHEELLNNSSYYRWALEQEK
ncbi:thiol reductant ABC exporter subunit CydC [Scrofimicrobium sp. R131]|uniref:Thiol reductant ABC exporter subunit CydC n=1 Tax=Scrofimicrobium appendicitidis TaxID=3079930 RepID=A0AAU7V5P8_9ACTO